MLTSPAPNCKRDIAHGVPNDMAADLARLLDVARTMYGLGHTKVNILYAVIDRNRKLARPLPVYSAGGLVETIDAVLTEDKR